jgi:hypothetical protein
MHYPPTDTMTLLKNGLLIDGSGTRPHLGVCGSTAPAPPPPPASMPIGRARWQSRSWCRGIWYFYFLHNVRSAMLKTLLYLRGDQSIVAVNVPWYLDSRRCSAMDDVRKGPSHFPAVPLPSVNVIRRTQNAS